LRPDSSNGGPNLDGAEGSGEVEVVDAATISRELRPDSSNGSGDLDGTDAGGGTSENLSLDGSGGNKDDDDLDPTGTCGEL
jgi:hypothetical protein